MRGVLLAMLLVLAGCGTTQHVSDPARKSIAAASVSREVAKPPEMFYLGPGNAPSLMFGAVGGALGARGTANERQAFQTHIERSGISIEAIAREEVAEAARKSGKLAIVEPPAPGGATLVVSVFQYGFGVPNAFSSRVVPVVGIKCELLDGAGKLLWSASDRLLTLGNPVEPATPEELRDDPKRIEEKWRLALRHLATNLMSGF
jgi:hypothetical protein